MNNWKFFRCSKLDELLYSLLRNRTLAVKSLRTSFRTGYLHRMAMSDMLESSAENSLCETISEQGNA